MNTLPCGCFPITFKKRLATLQKFCKISGNLTILREQLKCCPSDENIKQVQEAFLELSKIFGNMGWIIDLSPKENQELWDLRNNADSVQYEIHEAEEAIEAKNNKCSW
jgi:hypothetical protein